MAQTITLPAMSDEMTKAVTVTGRIVTVTDRDGWKFQGKVITVEAADWTTVTNADGVTLDHHCTTIGGHEDPWVSVRYINAWGDYSYMWTRLSRVTRGVCLAKY